MGPGPDPSGLFLYYYVHQPYPMKLTPFNLPKHRKIGCILCGTEWVQNLYCPLSFLFCFKAKSNNEAHGSRKTLKKDLKRIFHLA